MSTAVRMLIDKWAVPRMNCQRIVTSAMLNNTASVGVFKKLGFKHVRDVENAIRLPEGRGGHLKNLHVMEWTYNGD
jgi:RimJ/RimL family protein N-acetyltransferase